MPLALAQIAAPEGFSALRFESKVEQSINYSGAKELGDAAFGGWAHKVFLRSAPIELTDHQDVAKVSARILASDQGWGNTGFSYVGLGLLGVGGEGLKASVRMGGACKHDKDWRSVSLARPECGEALAAEEKDGAAPAESEAAKFWEQCADGDRVVLVIVSAPYGGYACKGYEGSIDIVYQEKVEEAVPLPAEFWDRLSLASTTEALSEVLGQLAAADPRSIDKATLIKKARERRDAVGVDVWTKDVAGTLGKILKSLP